MAISTILDVFNMIAKALITLFVGFVIAKLVSRIARRVMAEAELNRILAKAGIRPASDSLGMLLEYLIYTITILVILQQLGLTSIVIGIISIIAFIVCGFLLILTIRDVIPNMVTGVILRKKLRSHLGKQVRIGAVEGKLDHIGLVASIIRKDEDHYIPHLYTSKKNITLLRAN